MAEKVLDSLKISKGRASVDAYRIAHAKLYSDGWHKDISDAHTPLLENMLAKLKVQGFNSLEEFFAASEELTEIDRQTLKGKWH